MNTERYLQKIESMINDGIIINSQTFKDLEIDNALDQRDESKFEKFWLKVSDLISDAEIQNPLSEIQKININKIREISFKEVYKHTNSSDLSGYVSDDFELIAKALLLNVENKWLNGLFIQYKEGIFPHINIKEIQGSLYELLDEKL